MTADLRALAARIQEELADVARVVERTRRLAEKARTTNDDDWWDAVALNLHSFYVGVERILEAIAREVDGSVPGGPQRHRDLLRQLSGEVPGRRAAVISPECRNCLDEYLGLRHVVRNVYTFSLRPHRLDELARGLPGCLELVKRDLHTFVSFLTGGPSG